MEVVVYAVCKRQTERGNSRDTRLPPGADVRDLVVVLFSGPGAMRMEF